MLKTGKTIRYIYPDTGYFNITMYCTHVRTGFIDSVHKRSYSATANSTPVLCNDTLICGKLGLVLACRYLDRYKSYLWNGGHPFYAQYIKNPGLYWVKVTERNGCAYTDSAIISNAPNPIARFNISDTLVCFNRNRNLTFINTSQSADSIVSNLWDFDDFNPIDTSADTLHHVFPKIGQYLLRLKVKTVNNCFDDTFKVVEVLKSPKADFTITRFDSCFRNNRIEFLNTTVTDTAHMRFKWYFSEGYVLSNGNPVGPRTYNKAGKYSIQLIYENKNTCLDTLVKSVVIYPEAIAKFTTSIAVPCLGDSVHFMVLDSNKNKGVQYFWNFGDSKTDTAKAAKHLYQNKGLYTVRLLAQSKEQCNDSSKYTLRISGSTHADFSINDSSQCLDGNLFNFKNLSITDTGNITQHWWTIQNQKPDSNYHLNNQTFNLVGKQKIKLMVANTFHCKDSVVKEIELLKSPISSLKVNDPSQCENAQNFVFTGSNATLMDTLIQEIWKIGTDSFIGINPLLAYRFKSSGTYSVQYQLKNNYNCISKIQKTIIVNPKPKGLISVSDTSACLRQHSFNFINQSSISSGKIQSSDWQFGDQTSSNLQTPNPKKYSKAGHYLVALRSVSDSLCSDTALMGISVYPSAQVQIPSILSVCLNDSSLLSAVNSGPPIAKYTWEFGDNSSATGQTLKHRYKNSGLHQVLLITEIGKCKDSFNSSAFVLRIPDVSFRYLIKEGGQQNTLVTFSSLSNPNLKHQWNLDPFGQSKQLDTSIVVKDSIGFMAILKVTDANNCSNSDSQYVFISGPLKFFTPNTFTPNGDGHNEGFGPVGIQYARNYVFTIYSRWGEVLFRSENPNEQWDGHYQGKLCPNGVYIYTLQLLDVYSKNKYFKGSVLLQW